MYGALKSVAMLQRPRYPLPILTAILPGEPGLASFIEAKDDGSGGDNWSYKTRKTQPQTNQHPPFFTGWMPFMSPNQRCRSTEEKISHFKYLLSPNSSGGSSLEIIVTLLLLVLSQWMNVWIPLLLMLVMMCRSEVECRLCSSCVNSERGKAAVSWQDDQDCRVCPRSLLLSIGSAASSNRLHRSYSMYSSIQKYTNMDCFISGICKIYSLIHIHCLSQKLLPRFSYFPKVLWGIWGFLGMISQSRAIYGNWAVSLSFTRNEAVSIRFFCLIITDELVWQCCHHFFIVCVCS